MSTSKCLTLDTKQQKLVYSFLLENFSEYSLNIQDAHEQNLPQVLIDSISQQEKYILELMNRVGENVQEVHKRGDFHNNQKCTIQLLDSNEVNYIYKPVSPATLKFIDALLELCSEGFSFQRVKILSEWNDAYLSQYLTEDQPEKIDIEKYSYHFGALTLFAYLFRISDLHNENIMCINSTPVIVDGETLFYPEIEGLKPFSFESSLLLPGAFSHEAPAQKYGILVKSAFDQGVRQFAKNLSGNENKVYALLEQFSLLKTRVILKPTQYYQSVLKSSLHPSLLNNQDDRLQYLKQCLDGNHPVTKLIAPYELEALQKLDIPYFYCYLCQLFNVDDTLIPLHFRSFKDQKPLIAINKSSDELIIYSEKLNKSYNFLK